MDGGSDQIALLKDGEGLFVRVTCLDVVVGSATFVPAMGLTHTAFEPSSDYFMIGRYAREMGKWLKLRRYWSPLEGDLTDVIAEAWDGERLAMEDGLRQQLAVSHVMVVEAPRPIVGVAPIRVIADFRADHARVAAALFATDLGSGGRTRPSP